MNAGDAIGVGVCCADGSLPDITCPSAADMTPCATRNSISVCIRDTTCARNASEFCMMYRVSRKYVISAFLCQPNNARLWRGSQNCERVWSLAMSRKYLFQVPQSYNNGTLLRVKKVTQRYVIKSIFGATPFVNIYFD